MTVSSSRPPEFPSALTLPELLQRCAREIPDRRAYTFLVDGEDQEVHLTFGELDRRARSVATRLKAWGAEGQRVLLLYPSGLDFVAAFYGCLYAGAVAVTSYPPDPTRPKRWAPRFSAVAQNAGAKLVLTTQSICELTGEMFRIAPELNQLQWEAVEGDITEGGERFVAPPYALSALAFLQYTSGSTSTPKGVMVSHENFLHNAETVAKYMSFEESSVSVCWLPLFHDMGLMCCVVVPVLARCHSVLIEPAVFVQRPLRWVRALSRFHATHTIAPNFAYDLTARKVLPEEAARLDLSSVRMVGNGAEPVRAETIDRFHQVFAVAGLRPESHAPCYGLAEATLMIAHTPLLRGSAFHRVDGAALARDRLVPFTAKSTESMTLVGLGPVVASHRGLIVDPVSLEPLPPNHVGELWVSSPSVAMGYWQLPAETEQTFRAFTARREQGPFLRTGDLAVLRDDGELFITGRQKDLIIVAGRNHYPQDLERSAERAHPSLRPGTGAAFSVDVDGEEKVVLVFEVEKKLAVKPDAGGFLEEIARAVQRGLAENHDLELFALELLTPGSVPKTSSGKIQRRAARAQFLDGTLESVARWNAGGPSIAPPPKDAPSIEAWLVRALSEQLRLAENQVNKQRPFAECGLSSVAATSLVGALGAWLDRNLPPTLLWSYPTVEKLVAHLSGQAVTPAEPAAAKVSHEPIAIIGMSCRFPGANTPEQFWQLMVEGKDAVTEIPPERWDLATLFDPTPATPGKMYGRAGGFLKDVELFDARFFGISGREATKMDPQQRLLLEVAFEALERAGLSAQGLEGSQTGVFIGISTVDYAQKQLQSPGEIDAYLGVGNALSIAANRLSYFFDFHGPSMAVDTACSSSLVAVHQACQSLWAGESELALAGGVNLLLSPEWNICLSHARMLSPEGRCKTFDAGADGYVRSDGCGLVVLKRLSEAERDGDTVLAVIRGSAVNQDGKSNGITAPNALAQQAVLRKAMQSAQVEPAQVSYVEAHGTGTPLGDPIETGALSAVLGAGREQPLLLGSVKTQIGHCEAAAGVAGLIKVVLALQHGELPALGHFHKPNPDLVLKGLELLSRRRPWPRTEKPRIAGVSSFGFGGTNAHVVLEEAKAPVAQEAAARPAWLITLSAKSESALREQARQHASFLEARQPSLADLSLTLNRGRSHFPHRLALPATSAEGLRESLKAFAQDSGGGPLSVGVVGDSAPKVAFVFTGQGSQYSGMGQELYATEPVFREVIQRCEDLLRSKRELSLREVLFNGTDLLHDTGYTQPALFALEVALAELWRSWGIEPACVLGHSVGEYAAAYVAGVFSMEEGLALISERARLMQALPRDGSMVVALASEEEVRAALGEQERRVSLAAINGPASCVISGEARAVEQVQARLAARGVELRPLKVSHAFHSPLMDPCLESFSVHAQGYRFQTPVLPFISNLTGALFRPGKTADARYWTQHLREPVQFYAGMRTLETLGVDCVLEVGPGQSLLSLGKRCLAGSSVSRGWLPSLKQDSGESQTLLNSLGALHVRGAQVTWKALYEGTGASRVALPTYPFERQRYWFGSEVVAPLSQVETPVHSSVAAVSSTGSLREVLAQMVGRLLQVPPAQLRPQAKFLELGADSLMLLDLTRSVEKRFQVKLNVKQLFGELGTLDAAAAYLEARAPASLQTEAPLPVAAPPSSAGGQPPTGNAFLEHVVREQLALMAEQLRLIRAQSGVQERPALAPEVALAPVVAVPAREEVAPLSEGQREFYWLTQLGDDASGAATESGLLRLRGSLQARALEAALQQVVQRHEALRSVVLPGGEAQRILAHAPVTLQALDLSALPQAERETALAQRLEEEKGGAFSLTHAPQLRATLIRLAADEHVLVLSCPHFAADGVSLGIMVHELAAFYTQAQTGKAPVLDAPLPYREYERQSRVEGSARQSLLSFWRQRLGAAPALPLLPTDRPRTQAQRFGGDKVTLPLSPSLTQGLKNLSRAEGASLFMTLMAGAYGLLHRLSGQSELVLGFTASGRRVPGSGAMVGHAANAVPLALRVDERGSFRALLGQLRQALLDTYAQPELSLSQLFQELGYPRDPSRPLLPVMFNFEPRPPPVHFEGLSLELMRPPVLFSKYELELNVVDVPAGLQIEAFFNTDLFDTATVQDWLQQYAVLLEQGVQDPARRLSAAAWMERDEREQVLHRFNDTAVPLPAQWSDGVGAWVERGVQVHPERPALEEADGHTLSYRELALQSAQVAAALVEAGVGPELRVGLLEPRSASFWVAVLGVWRAGGAYVPLDAKQPVERLRQMVADSQMDFLVASESQKPLVDALLAGLVHAPLVLWRGKLTVQDSVLGKKLPQRSSGGKSLAYVLFTSGSTGRPKGAMVEDGGMLNHVFAKARDLGLDSSDTVAQTAGVSFDISVWQAVTAWSVGGRTLVVEEESVREPARLLATLDAQGVTVVEVVPSLLSALVEQVDAMGARAPALRPLRWMIPTGEALPVELCNRWLRAYPAVALVNAYGPTECSDDVTHEVVRGLVEGHAVAIGRPVANTQLYVLDADAQLLPVGREGEIYVGGEGVGRGYWGQPSRTAEAFVPDAFSGRAGARLYRTGDLGRWRADGRLDFLGRVDFQVKIRGHRIELGEVEEALRKLQGVKDAVVSAQPSPSGQPLLVAHVAAQGQTVATLRTALTQVLPEAMVPAGFVLLERLPLTAHGKVDRRALPPWNPAHDERPFVAPRTAIQWRLADIWRDVLGVSRVGLDDSFFTLGGHSLLATRVLSRLRETWGVELSLRALFDAPLLVDLAERVAQAQREKTEGKATLPLRGLPRDRPLPASLAQERLWFVEQLRPGTALHTVPDAYRLEGSLNRAVFERAVGALLARHESLRTCLVQVEEALVQSIVPLESFSLEWVDLASWPASSRYAEARRLLTEEARRSFDLAQAPLCRPKLFRLSPTLHFLSFTTHHAVTDGTSREIVAQELSQLYDAFLEGKPSPLAPKTLDYADFAVWERSLLEQGALDSQLAYWKQQLAGAKPTLALPTDHPRPAVPSHRGKMIDFAFSAELSEGLRALAQAEGVSLFMVLQAAFDVLLFRWSEQSDLCTGAALAGRTHQALEQVVGYFTRVAVLRVDLSGDPTFRELLARVREVFLGAFANQDVPFEKLLEGNAVRDTSRTPLFQVLFSSQPPVRAASSRAGLSFLGFDVANDVAKYDLAVHVVEEPAGRALNGAILYATDLYEASTVQALMQQYEALLLTVVQQPEARVETLRRRERRLQARAPRKGAGETEARWVHQRVEQVALAKPEAPAVEESAGTLSYGELNRRANQLAHQLRSLGVGPDVRVGLCVTRSSRMLVGMLGILKAGGSYVPLDPAYPKERLSFVMEDASLPVVVSEAGSKDSLSGLRTQLVLLDADEASLSALPTTAPPVEIFEGTAAYVIYTSGSTGRPKGVVVTHENLRHFVAGHAETYLRRPGVRQLLTFSMAFDGSVGAIFPTLCEGGVLVLPALNEEKNPEALAKRVEVSQVTHFFAVPALYWELLDAGQKGQLSSLQMCIVAGEACSPLLVERHRRVLPETPLFNMYGPTEVTVWATSYDTGKARADATLIPIGHLMSRMQAHVLDAALQPVAEGEAGDLYLGGAGITRGYLQRPELTAQSFVPNPFGEPGSRLYRTGDSVRWQDGALCFLGRADRQVKVRGFRIELGEVEAVLLQHPSVKEAVCLAREDGPGEKRLVAYVEPLAPGLQVESLKAFLGEKLPAHMVPATWVVLDAFPRNPVGKVDRQALPAPESEEEAVLAPRTPTETQLVEIFQAVLQRQAVGVDANFFALGGHSLLVTKLLSRINARFSLSLPLSSIFESPSIEELAQQIDAALGEHRPPQRPSALRPVSRLEPLALSLSQEWFWFLSLLDPNSPVSNMPTTVQLKGPLDRVALERSFSELFARHESLRTTFSSVNGQPVQLIAAPKPFTLPVVDLSHLLPLARVAEADRLRLEEASKPFDLLHGPLFRVTLLRLDTEEHALLLTFHHIVADGGSYGVLLSELERLYTAFRAGKPSPLPALPIQFADFAAWHRQELVGPKLDASVAYWKKTLAGVPVIELPTDHAPPATRTFKGERLPVQLPASLRASLDKLSEQEGATLFITLFSAYNTLLHRYTGQEDILLTSTSSGRERVETEQLVGYLANTLLLRSNLAGNPTFRELMARTRAVMLGAHAHQHMPLDTLVQLLQPERDRSQTTVLQANFSLVVGMKDRFELPELSARVADVDNHTTMYPLTVELWEDRGKVTGHFLYSPDVFERATVERMSQHFQILLEGIVAQPDARLHALPLLTAAEKNAQLSQWNRQEVQAPPANSIHALFEAQVERTPEALAVSFQGQSLRYRELNAKANQLAHFLRSQGVGPESRVGLCVRPSLEGIIALYGVLKAGGAYVPLDPDAPYERLAFSLEEAGVSLVLSQADLEDSLPSGALSVVSLDSGWPAIARHSAENPAPLAQPQNVAYVIFTSGSTGEPKGVLVQHASVVNHNVGVAKAFGLKPSDRVLQFTPLNFDAAAEEIYPPLLCGASIVVRGELMPSREFNQLIESEQLSVLSLPPAFLHEWVSELHRQRQAVPSCLRLVLLGGEKILPETLVLWHAIGASQIPWINVYGPTEATVTSALCKLTSDKDTLAIPILPIGGPVPNAQIYLLDSYLEPLPPGRPGEIFIGGAGLARGYLNKPDQTAERFVPDPFRPGSRLYRTGDLARYLPDGRIEFLGRVDHQVKIRGFRIELSEVESGLRKHPAVQDAVVVAWEDAPGAKRLVAYLVPHPGKTASVGELRRFLAETLPDYMLPSCFERLESLPLTPNGKVDRKALPEPSEERPELEQDFVSPRNPTEQSLSDIWAQVLGATRVGVHDNFFELGGQSLLATQVVSRVREVMGIDLPLRHLFEAPTVALLAERWPSLTQAEGTPVNVNALQDSEVDALLKEMMGKHST